MKEIDAALGSMPAAQSSREPVGVQARAATYFVEELLRSSVLNVLARAGPEEEATDEKDRRVVEASSDSTGMGLDNVDSLEDVVRVEPGASEERLGPRCVSFVEDEPYMGVISSLPVCVMRNSQLPDTEAIKRNRSGTDEPMPCVDVMVTSKSTPHAPSRVDKDISFGMKRKLAGKAKMEQSQVELHSALSLAEKRLEALTTKFNTVNAFIVKNGLGSPSSVQSRSRGLERLGSRPRIPIP